LPRRIGTGTKMTRLKNTLQQTVRLFSKKVKHLVDPMACIGHIALKAGGILDASFRQSPLTLLSAYGDVKYNL